MRIMRLEYVQAPIPMEMTEPHTATINHCELGYFRLWAYFQATHQPAILCIPIRVKKSRPARSAVVGRLWLLLRTGDEE